MKKSELELMEKVIRYEYRKIFLKNFKEFQNEMNNSLYDTFIEKYLPKIVEETQKFYGRGVS